MERCCRGCQRPLTPDETSFIKDGLPYCCAGCATARKCTCAPPVARASSPRTTSRLERAAPLEAHLNDWLS